MLTLLEAITKLGKKNSKPRSVAWHNAMAARQPDRPKAFPSERDVLYRALIESQAPGVTFNSRMETDVIYPSDEFSSKGLTDWYVAGFCRLNGLKP